MRKVGSVLAIVLAGANVYCGDTVGPETVAEEWHGSVSRGETIEIKGINGDIIATRATGENVTVTFSKEGRHSDPAEIEIEVLTHSGGVTICAVYPDVAGEPPNECAPGDGGRMSTRDNDVEVTFRVSVPEGVNLVGWTINGSVTATNLDSDIVATSVNGSMDLSTSQHAIATTVNGSIRSTVGLARWDRDLSFTSVNGDITVFVPTNVNADVRLSTTNGSVSVDFPVTIVNPVDVRGVLGDGSRALRVTTVNGDIELHRDL